MLLGAGSILGFPKKTILLTHSSLIFRTVRHNGFGSKRVHQQYHIIIIIIRIA